MSPNVILLCKISKNKLLFCAPNILLINLIILFSISGILWAQSPSYRYSHSWKGINYPWNMSIGLDHKKIYIRDQSGGVGNKIKVFDTSGNLLNNFNCYEGDGIGVDYYGTVYIGAYDIGSEVASVKVYNDGNLIRSWNLPITYDPNDNYLQSMTIRVDNSSDPNVYIICSDDWHNGTVFKYGRYGTLITKWEPSEMLTSHVNMSLDYNNKTLYLLSFNWARIYKYDENGNLLKWWGNSTGGGSNDGEFDHPYGIANTIYGIIGVADTGNDRVQFFNSFGTFLGEMGNYGSPPKKFDGPRCIIMTASGDWMYVLDNNGIHAFTTSSTSIYTDNRKINDGQDAFKLFQNYPNPFNSSTRLHYSISKSESVSIKIFNGLGQLITTLKENEFQQPGMYNVTWNGLDSSGNPVSSGIYIIRLETSGQILHKKVVLSR